MPQDNSQAIATESPLAKCLLVDDLEENLLALEALLVDEPAELYRARSGIAALELLLEHDFALALVDVQMPEMNGFQLAEIMRSTEKTRAIPIIFITAGEHDKRWVFRGYDAGAVDFMFKPLDSHVVRSKVRAFLELHQQKRLLEEKVEALRRTETELARALRVRDEFISIASHELRTPLTPLKLQLQMLRRAASAGFESFPRERLEKVLETSDRQVNHLSHLVDDLLDVSRISLGKVSMNTGETDLSEIVRQVVEQFEDELLNAQCHVDIQITPKLVGLWDKDRIQQIVANLLSNAIKYAAGSEIVIRTQRAGERAQLIVQDHGMGIPDERLPHIFDRFERAVPERSISGLGLGLYIARQNAALHGGDIYVQSTLHEGSTFVVTLPLRHESGAAQRETR
jgi:signal transduction histidine kinase